MARETIIFDGKPFHRYPESKQASHRNYFMGYWREKKIYLHRAVWEKANGPVPEGFHVHHKDGNPANNKLTNLECINEQEHWDAHEEERKTHANSPGQMAHLEAIRPLSKAWHASGEGNEWHRNHAVGWKKENRGKRKATCTICGSEYLRDAVSKSTLFHCSNKCRARFRRDSGLD